MSTSRVRGRGRGTFRNNRNPQATPSLRNSSREESSQEHHGSCCTSIEIILELNLETMTFLNELKNMWNIFKKSPPVVSKLHQHFNICGNPYEESLRLMYNCQEFQNAKTKSLPVFIVEELKVWSLNNNSNLLTPTLKINAFKTVSQQNAMILTKLVVEVFEMHEDRDIFLDIIKCMLAKKRYKEACQSVILLKLHDKFSAEDFLLPLILQDKMYGIDDFLSASPRHQVELVTLLDSILGKPSIRDAMATYVNTLNVPEVKWDKLYSKPLKKLITRLVKTFKLSHDLTPNLNRKRNEGALQFLMHKRFIDNSFGHESWKEMVQEAVGSDRELQKELVSQVCQFGDVTEALWWAHFYKLPKEDWPHTVKMLEENPDETRLYQRNVLATPTTDNWNIDDEVPSSEPIDYHKYALPENTIILIDSQASFERFLDTGLQDVEIVGIDCEWKPSFGSQKNELALMQIATRQKVFILDIISIGTKLQHLWQELGKFLFNNCDILKIGFGFSGDTTMIKHSLPELNFTQKQVGFLDLLSLWKILEKHPKVVLPHEVPSAGPSLGTLVHQCLGRPLDKSDQFSNWEKRPLRQSQLVYAALDAYCLIEVYDVIKSCCEKADFPFEENCFNLMANEKMPKKKTKKPLNKKPQQSLKVEEEIPQPPSPHSQQVPATSIKVVCDTMLQGLGKNLRRCGVDTAILENNMDHMECVKYAQDESRYILTRGNAFNKLYGYVPMGYCLKVISDNVDEQLKEFIDYYKVIVTKEDVFSICQACNARSFLKLSHSTMLALRDSSSSANYYPADYDDNCDEATGFSSDEDFDCAPGPPVRKWDLYSDEKIDVGLCQTRLGAKIQIKDVPEGILDKVQLFYVCEKCGKVYWDGSHFEKVLSGRLQGIVQ